MRSFVIHAALLLHSSCPACGLRTTSQLAGSRHFKASRVSALRCAAPVDLSSAAWAALKKELDSIPVFTCVNEASEPLGYERDGELLAIFFAGVDRAQQELETTSANYPELGLRLLGVGLGDAFERTQRGNALIVPASNAILAAGDDWGSDGQLPLYTCLSMSKPRSDGSPATPLFMCPDDAQASLTQAQEAAKARSGATGLSPAQIEQLQLVCTSLPQAIDMVLTGREKEVCGDRFQFVASSQSIDYLRSLTQASKAAAARAAATADGMRTIFPGGSSSDSIFPS